LDLESGIEINPNSQEVGPEETHSSRILGATGYLAREPVLALARIIVGQQTCCASVPPSAEPVAQLQAHAGVALDIEDVSGFHAVFCYDPELHCSRESVRTIRHTSDQLAK
jgi:hypothetical protein